ncbi:MAG TPA: MlaD family protein [Thermoleophilaceae bacterium]|nr:MlaD family protein [Thermoleophilaceae bacterium]
MRHAIRKHVREVVAMVALVAIALGVSGYILSQQRLRFPLIEPEAFTLRAELEDAQAVIAGQGQTVRVAGVEIGDIGKVQLEDGKALVELQLDAEYEGLVRADATALLRAKTGLKDMFLEVDPGRGRPLRRGERIPAENTAPDVDPDEILSVLDADTRDYLKLLISGAGKGLRGRGPDLREAFRRLGPLHRDLDRVTQAVAARRRNLARLVNRYGLLVRELGGRGEDLTRLVRASEAALSALAAEDHNLSATVSKLPGSLRQTESTLAKVDTLAGELSPALDALRPPIRRLDETNSEVLPLAVEGTPILRDRVRPFARSARPFVRDAGSGAARLAVAAPDFTTAFGKVNRLANIMAFNPGGAEGLTGDLQRDRAREEGFLYWLAWAAQNGVSVFSTADAQGVWRRLSLCNLEPTALARMLTPALSKEAASLQADVLEAIAASGFGGPCP